jgi:hypothetical protein
VSPESARLPYPLCIARVRNRISCHLTSDVPQAQEEAVIALTSRAKARRSGQGARERSSGRHASGEVEMTRQNASATVNASGDTGRTKGKRQWVCMRVPAKGSSKAGRVGLRRATICGKGQVERERREGSFWYVCRTEGDGGVTRHQALAGQSSSATAGMAASRSLSSASCFPSRAFLQQQTRSTRQSLARARARARRTECKEEGRNAGTGRESGGDGAVAKPVRIGTGRERSKGSGK